MHSIIVRGYRSRQGLLFFGRYWKKGDGASSTTKNRWRTLDRVNRPIARLRLIRCTKNAAIGSGPSLCSVIDYGISLRSYSFSVSVCRPPGIQPVSFVLCGRNLRPDTQALLSGLTSRSQISLCRSRLFYEPHRRKKGLRSKTRPGHHVLPQRP